MTPASKWNWIALPAVLIVGVVGGSAATVLTMTRVLDLRKPGPPAILTPSPPPAVAPPAPDTSPPLPEPGRTPFDLADRLPPTPAGMPEAGAPLEGAEAPEPDLPVDPPLVSHGSFVEVNPPPGYFDLPAPHKGDGTDPPILKPGQVLTVEVLEALPGRPIQGDRVVRPDGTISLGFYGDLRVAGLNRLQAKVKLIELMRKTMHDEVLGLYRLNLQTNKYEAVPPVESNRVFIDESSNFLAGKVEAAARPQVRTGKYDPDDTTTAWIMRIESKLDQVIKEVKEWKAPAANPSHPPAAAAAPPNPLAPLTVPPLPPPPAADSSHPPTPAPR